MTVHAASADRSGGPKMPDSAAPATLQQAMTGIRPGERLPRRAIEPVEGVALWLDIWRDTDPAGGWCVRLVGEAPAVVVRHQLLIDRLTRRAPRLARGTIRRLLATVIPDRIPEPGSTRHRTNRTGSVSSDTTDDRVTVRVLRLAAGTVRLLFAADWSA